LGVALARCGATRDAIAHFTEALRLQPNDPGKHFNVANILANQRRTREAVFHYREAIRLNPHWPEPKRTLAWILATDGDSTLRSGTEAGQFAESACEDTGYKDAGCLDALAAAYAETGRFNEAVATAQRAAELAPAEVGAEIRQRLALYRSGKPYRAP